MEYQMSGFLTGLSFHKMKESNLEICTSIPVLLEGLPLCNLSERLLYFKLLFDHQRSYTKGIEVNAIVQLI